MKKILDYIKEEDYANAYLEFIKHFDSIKEDFELETYENPNEKLFDFILYTGERTKEPNIIYYCSMILVTSLNYFTDAYKHSYALAQKLLKEKPNQLDNCEWLLFFADVPEKLMNKADLERILVSTLRLDNQNTIALNLLNTKFSESDRERILASIK